MRLFLCGDVMTGRGIDQIMPRQCDPVLYERYMHSALGYVELAEDASGRIPRAAPADYIWGDALEELDRRKPDLRIINLETSITAGGDPEPKGINYRMHPDNVECLKAGRIDCCALANNHVLDWGRKGLADTLETLATAGIATAGAGPDADSAARPAILETAAGKRLLVFAFGCPSSGIPERWAAGAERPGVNVLDDSGASDVPRVARDIMAWKRPGDLVLVSIHWGGNWGYDMAPSQRDLAHALLDQAGADIILGHSSHHPKAIEIHAGKPILYGCGDFINDYEGIGGNEEFRPDLAVGYVVDIDDQSHLLARIELIAFRIAKFRLERALPRDTAWLADRLDRECGRFGHRIRRTGDNVLALSW
jgi:poly-gamma-glutamate synthesis protein (capsule biosynthesis protein)